MNNAVNRIGLSYLMLCVLAVAGTKAADSNSNGGNDSPPPPPPSNSGSQDNGGQHHPRRPPPSADMFFQRFDLNKDGVVTFEEFVKGHATPPPPPPDGGGKNNPPPPALTQDQLKERFNSLDANGDGKITRDEYEAALKRGPPQGQGQGQGRGQGGQGHQKSGGQGGGQ